MTSRIQWQSPGLFWISMIALAIVLGAGMVFYRPQLRPIQRLASWVWVLPWVRSLGLGILAIVLLRPAIMTPIRDEGRGIVAVLVDRSKSMNAIDAGRSPVDLVTIAAGLGRLNSSTRQEELSQLRQHVQELARLADDAERADTELKYARLAGSGRAMEAAQAHYRQARSALDARIKSIAASTTQPVRDDIANINSDNDVAGEQIALILKRINAMQETSDAQLYQDDESVRAICNALANQSRIELVENILTSATFEKLKAQRTVRVFANDPLNDAAANFDPTNLVADELHTDLVGQLRDLHRRLGGQRVAAVVLFSDGRENNQTSPADALVDWPEAPIIAVDVATSSPRDLSIAKISVPASAAVGETVRVRGSVRRTGFDARDVEIVFTAEGQQQTKNVTLLHDSSDVEFTFTPRRAGACQLTLAVTAQNGEATVANNQVQRTIKVTSDRSTVAVIAEPAASDMQQLRSLLKTSPRFDLLDGPIESGKCPLSPADLQRADVIVLGNVPVSSLDAQQWEAINLAVTVHGGSVILCPSEPTILSSYSDQPLIASMLPWLGDAQPAWRSSPSQFRVAPKSAEDFDLIKLSDDSEENHRLWDQMPRIDRVMSLPVPRAGVRVILSEQGSDSPALTQINCGAGRAFFLATEEIWRWRSVGGEEPEQQDRFWKEFIGFAGHSPYAISDGELALDADRLSLQPGDSLAIRARSKAEGATLRIERDGALFREIPIKSEDSAATRTVVSDLESGDYTLRLSNGSDGILLPVRVAAKDEDEMRDVSGNHEELVRIAGSRGAVLTMADLASLPQRLSELQIIESRFSEMRLWDSPYLFMFVVSCFGVEWALRKHVGLT